MLRKQLEKKENQLKKRNRPSGSWQSAMKEPDALRGGDGIVEDMGRNMEKKTKTTLYKALMV
jgi:hypothetical protein